MIYHRKYYKTQFYFNCNLTIYFILCIGYFRHWISKHSQDFEHDLRLKNLTIEFLEDIVYSPNLLPAEHKAAAQLLRLLTKEESESCKVDLAALLTIPLVSKFIVCVTVSPILFIERQVPLQREY